MAPERTRHRSRQDPVSCESCRRKKLRCDRQKPCSNCRVRDVSCIFQRRTENETKLVDQPDSASLIALQQENITIRHRLQNIERLLEQRPNVEGEREPSVVNTLQESIARLPSPNPTTPDPSTAGITYKGDFRWYVNRNSHRIC